MADAHKATREEAEDPGCWQKKAAYDHCFDQWYTDVFLQNKANGQVGCQEEYKAYTKCFLKELDKDKQLVESIKSVMNPELKKRWSRSTDAAAAANDTPKETQDGTVK